MINKYTI